MHKMSGRCIGLSKDGQQCERAGHYNGMCKTHWEKENKKTTVIYTGVDFVHDLIDSFHAMEQLPATMRAFG